MQAPNAENILARWDREDLLELTERHGIRVTDFMLWILAERRVPEKKANWGCDARDRRDAGNPVLLCFCG